MRALDTRDVTLPRRLWSWLAKQASEQQSSVDEVIAALIDAHRHPEQTTGVQDTQNTEGQGNPEHASHASTDDAEAEKAPERATEGHAQGENSGQATTSTAERLRRMNERLDAIRGDDEGAEEGIRRDQSTSEEREEETDIPPDTDALMNEAMSALQRSEDAGTGASTENDHSADTQTDDASMFDVVRDGGT